MKLKNLAKLRRARGVTQTELAEIINVSPAAVAHWEGGKGCTADNLARLCATFNVSSDYLLGLRGAKLEKPVVQLRRVA